MDYKIILDKYMQKHIHQNGYTSDVPSICFTPIAHYLHRINGTLDFSCRTRYLYEDDKTNILRRFSETQRFNLDLLNTSVYDDTFNVMHIYTKTGVKIYELFEEIAKVDTNLIRLNSFELLLKQNCKRLAVYKYDNILLILTDKTNPDYKTVMLALPEIFGLALDDNESQVLKELIETNEVTTETLDKLYEQDLADLEKEEYNNVLELFTTTSTRKIASLEESKKVAEHDIQTLEDRLTTYYNKLEEVNKALFTEKYVKSLRTKEQEESAQELLDFLTTAKPIKGYQIMKEYDSLLIEMYVNVPIKYYDKEALETMLNNPNFVESMTYNRKDRITLVKLLKECFLEEKFQLNTLSKIYINVTEGYVGNHSVTTEQYYSYNAYPHPHIMRYNCFGENKTSIKEAIIQNNYLGAINQAVGSCYNFNFTDSTVFLGFCRDLTNSFRNLKCFIKDNTMLSFNDIIELYDTEEFLNTIEEVNELEELKDIEEV